MEVLKRMALIIGLTAATSCHYDLDELRGARMTGDGGFTECDEVAQTGCVAPDKCVTCVLKNTPGTRGCVASGMAPAGAVCMQAADCAPGTICFNAASGTGFTCRQYCKTAADCPTTAPTCMPFKDYACYFLMGTKATFGLCT